MADDTSKSTKTTERVQDPGPDRYRYLADVFYRFANNKISIADIARIPRKNLRALAGRVDDGTEPPDLADKRRFLR